MSRTHAPSLKAVFAHVQIAFFTVLVKREALPSVGLPVDESRRSTRSLAAFVFMEAQSARYLVDLLENQGAVLRKHIGVADMMHGPLIACAGIEYVRDDERDPPSWTAFRVPDGSLNRAARSPRELHVRSPLLAARMNY